MKKLVLATAAIFSVVVANAQCQAAFGYTNNGNVYSFSDSSTASSGNVSSWLWQFGDNSLPSTQQSPTHTYAACGTYVVTLSIVTSSFCTSSTTDTVVVTQGTLPSFTYSVDTTNGNVSFQGSPTSTLLNYSWDFGDNTTGTGTNPVHAYATGGTYIVCLTTSDSAAICTYMVCDTITVYIAPPNCNVTWTNNSIIAGQQTFTAQPVNLNWTYTWDFGDASAPGNGFLTTHTYASSGTYTVCLTVLDTSNSCTSQFCDTVNVTLPTSCPVTFTNVYLLGNMAFTPTPLNPLNTYVWDFGDATSPFTGMLANHMYAAPGTYTVCVTMTTFQGCTSTFCDTVMVPSSIGVEEMEAGVGHMSVQPNPANEVMNVSYAVYGSEPLVLEICDYTGRLVFATTINSEYGDHTVVIDLSGISSGAYIVRITGDGIIAQRPLIRN